MSFALTFVEIKRGTEKALLLDIDGDEYWCPRSVVDDGEDVESPKGAAADFGETISAELYIKSWWLEKEGLR